MPHIARAGAGPDPVGGTRDIRPCHRWAPGHGDDLYTCRAMPGRRPTGPSRWMASRCVTGRSERTLAEPPICSSAAATRGMAATSADVGILCRPAAGGARSRPSAVVARLLIAGTQGYMGMQIASNLPARRICRRVRVGYPVYGTLAGIVTGQVLWDAPGPTCLLGCNVPAGVPHMGRPAGRTGKRLSLPVVAC